MIKIIQSTLKIIFLTFESNDSFADYVILLETSNLLDIQHLNNTQLLKLFSFRERGAREENLPNKI